MGRLGRAGGAVNAAGGLGLNPFQENTMHTHFRRLAAALLIGTATLATQAPAQAQAVLKALRLGLIR